MEILSVDFQETYTEVTYKLKKPWGIPDKISGVRIDHLSISGLETVSQEQFNCRLDKDNTVYIPKIDKTIILEYGGFQERPVGPLEEVFDGVKVLEKSGISNTPDPPPTPT